MDYLFFYQELIQLWHKICDTEPTQPSEILGQSVWNNRFILCKRDPIFCNEFYSKGIRTVYDLICQDHKFLDWHATQQSFGLARKDVIKWFGIIKAIPNSWKKVVKNEVVDLQVEMPLVCDIKIRGNLTSVCKISVKKLFTICFSNDLEETCLTKHYPNMLNLSEIDWKKVYFIPRKVTIETSLRVLQYKILNNIFLFE